MPCTPPPAVMHLHLAPHHGLTASQPRPLDSACGVVCSSLRGGSTAIGRGRPAGILPSASVLARISAQPQGPTVFSDGYAASQPSSGAGYNTGRNAIISDIISRFFDCLNSHDLATMFSLLAPEATYHNTALQVHCAGKQAVVKFYVEVLSSIPKGSSLVLDQVAVSEAPESAKAHVHHSHVHNTCKASVDWHLEIGGVHVPGSEGRGQYRVDPTRGLITELKDSPQVAVSVLLPALAMATPAINLASPVLLPALNLVAGALPRADGGSSSVFPQPGPSLIPSPADMAASAAESIKGLLGGGQPMGATLTPWATDWKAPHTAGSPSYSRNSNGNGQRYGTSSSTSSPQGHVTAHGNGTSSSSSVRSAAPMPAAAAAAAAPGPAYSVPMRELSPEPAQPQHPPAAAPSAQAYAFAFRDSPDPAAASSPAPEKPVDWREASVMEGSESEDEREEGGAARSVTRSPAAEPEGAQEPLVQAASFVDLKPGMAPANLTGVWEKDTSSSQAGAEAYERMLDVLGLSGLQRVTARLIEGVELKHTAEGLTVTYLTIVPFFKVTESIKFGASSLLPRRDLRSGKQTAIAETVPGGVRLKFEWGAPHPGHLTEEYVLVVDGGQAEVPDEMVVTSHLQVDNNTASVVQVYKRSGKNRDQLLKESRSRNKSLESVLDKQRKQWGK